MAIDGANNAAGASSSGGSGQQQPPAQQSQQPQQPQRSTQPTVTAEDIQRYQLFMQFLAIQSAAASSPPLTQPPAASTSTGSQPFVGPLTNNPASGASNHTSLLSTFPEVEAAVITSIIQHEFWGSDLYKLDSRYRDKTERQALTLNGTTLELTSNDSALKDYKSLNSIAIPLDTYFSILIMHTQHTGHSASIAVNFFHYNAHLIKIASEYEWPAVVAYHMAFFAKQRLEMADGRIRIPVLIYPLPIRPPYLLLHQHLMSRHGLFI